MYLHLKYHLHVQLSKCWSQWYVCIVTRQVYKAFSMPIVCVWLVLHFMGQRTLRQLFFTLLSLHLLQRKKTMPGWANCSFSIHLCVELLLFLVSVNNGLKIFTALCMTSHVELFYCGSCYVILIRWNSKSWNSATFFYVKLWNVVSAVVEYLSTRYVTLSQEHRYVWCPMFLP